MKYQYWIIFYFIAALILASTNLLALDTYYYWEWSRHLDLSYYDGSPLIAYLIKLFTLVFGDTLFALTLLGISVTVLTAWVIYKTAKLSLSKEASLVAMTLWLFAPLTTLDILKQTTYDTPLILFWATSIYFATYYIKFQQIQSLYGLGISIGLLMLSKYTGVVLILGLGIFLLTTHYWYLFKTLHFYLIILISLIIFSPVIVWNYQHEWQSFIYQLNTHKHNYINPFLAVFKSLIFTFIPALNFMLLSPFLYKKTANYPVYLYQVISITFLVFYFIVASEAGIRAYWLAPFLISSALLAGWCFEENVWRQWFKILIVIYGVISVSIIVNNSLFFHATKAKKFIYYNLIQEFNQSYPILNQPILTSGWLEARMLFFLNNKPFIYTIDCNSQQNQYAFWSADIQQAIAKKDLKKAIFIDQYDRRICLKNYFDDCQRLPTKAYRRHELYAFQCRND